jgi:hypothetical protein
MGELHVNPFAALEAPGIVYVRPTRGAAIIESLPAPDRSACSIKPERVYYTIHEPSGRRIAIYESQLDAISKAREHEYAPIRVH